MSHAGGLGDDVVFTAASFSGPQAQSASRAKRLVRTGALCARLLRQLPGVRLEPLDVVQFAQHVAVVRLLVGDVDHRAGLVVAAGILVRQPQVPVGLGDLARLELEVLLRVLRRRVEGFLPLLPYAPLPPSYPALS